MTYRKKLIEVALPLDAINKASAREKSIRHGHPSTLHLWWARRPLAACRAVLFASLVDDPSNDLGEEEAKVERMRLFGILEELVKWENSNDEDVLGRARAEILRSTGGNPPPVLDPFCGGVDPPGSPTPRPRSSRLRPQPCRSPHHQSPHRDPAEVRRKAARNTKSV